MHFYFVPQTGRVSMNPIASGNFYCFKLSTVVYREVSEAIQAATLGSAGLDYDPEFLRMLSACDEETS